MVSVGEAACVASTGLSCNTNKHSGVSVVPSNSDPVCVLLSSRFFVTSLQKLVCYHAAQNLISENVKIKIYKTVVLYGCETWSLKLKNEHRLRLFENRVLRVYRRIFGPERDESTRGWRKFHNEELHNLFSSPNIIRMIKSRGLSWMGHVARMGR
jgi:hypothetical protein